MKYAREAKFHRRAACGRIFLEAQRAKKSVSSSLRDLSDGRVAVIAVAVVLMLVWFKGARTLGPQMP